MNKGIIRWLFLVLLFGFLGIMKSMNMLYRNQNMFLVLLLLFSAITVFGILRFRDGVMKEDDEIVESEADAILKKLQAEAGEEKE